VTLALPRKRRAHWVAAQEPPEPQLHHALELAVEHRKPADDVRRPRHPVRRAGEPIPGRGPHEVLPEAVALAAGPPLGLVPIGRRWMKRRSGSSQETAI
jgi:hypothetical protein